MFAEDVYVNGYIDRQCRNGRTEALLEALEETRESLADAERQAENAISELEHLLEEERRIVDELNNSGICEVPQKVWLFEDIKKRWN